MLELIINNAVFNKVALLIISLWCHELWFELIQIECIFRGAAL